MAAPKALFSALKPAVLEAPRHATLVDDHGIQIDRGQTVLIKSVLGDAALDPGAASREFEYLVSVPGDDGTTRAELVVPETWLRKKNTIATSDSVEFLSLSTLLARQRSAGGFLIPLFQRRYCWSEVGSVSFQHPTSNDLHQLRNPTRSYHYNPRYSGKRSGLPS